MNKVFLVGHLGRDPEVRYIANGTAVANFSLATSEKYGGETKTEWHKVVVWGKLAEICGEYMHKGMLVAVDGRIQTNSWEDNEGNKRETKEIVASQVKMLGGKGDKPREESKPTSSTEDDLPF